MSTGLGRARLSQESQVPLWQQTAEILSERIASGALPKGSRLTSERDLCEDLGISRVTLRKALSHMEESGLVTSSRGRGWFVAGQGAEPRAGANEWPHTLESFSETASRLGLEASSQVVVAEVRTASLDIAELLGVAPGSKLFYLERVRLLENVPTAVDITQIPLVLVPEIVSMDFASSSLFAALLRAGVRPTHADVTISAAAADQVIATQLQIGLGSPLLNLHQVAMDSHRALFTSHVSYAGERYRMRTSFQRDRS